MLDDSASATLTVRVFYTHQSISYLDLETVTALIFDVWHYKNEVFQWEHFFEQNN